MSKFVGIKTYERFRSLWENDAIDEFSLNFIIDTGQLYTHGIFINGAVFGTAANGAVPLSVAGITNTLALSSHTHSNYLEKNADIDISSHKIKSGDKDLLFYSGGSLYLGNITNPTYISGNNLYSVRGTNVYNILDTSNFSISNTLPTGYTYNNTAYIKYGNNSHQIDYVKRINTSQSFDYLNTYTQAGTNLLNGVQYGYITLYTDNVYTNPSWAQLRINIPGKSIQYRTSADADTWISVTDSTAVKLGTAGSTNITNGSLISALSSNGIIFQGGTNSFKVGDGTNSITVSVSHGLSTKNITINGTAYALYTSASSLPTILAPTSYAGTGGQVLATNSNKNGLTWVSLPTKSSWNYDDVYTKKTQPIPVIVGPSTDTTAGTWTGTTDAFSAYANGLTIIYVPAVAGASTTTLNINGLGAKTCHFTNTSKLTTHFAVGTPIMFTYYGGYWKRADYDSNSNTQYYLTLNGVIKGHSGKTDLGTIWAPEELASTGGYILATNSGKTGLEWVAKPVSNVTTSAIIGSSATATTQITAAQTNPYYNLLEGGAVSRSIRFVAGTGITISAATDGQITITNASPDANHNTDRTGIKLASVSGTKKTDSTLIIANSGTGLSIAGGTNLIKIGDGTNYIEVPITHGLSTKNITINGTTYALYTSASSLPTFVAPGSYGTANYILATNSSGNGLTWVVKPTSNVTTTAIVGNSATATSQITSAQTNPYYNLIEGGSVTRSIRFVAGNGITISAGTDGQITITNSKPHVADDTNTWRPIKVNGTEKRGTAITSGDIDFINGSNTTVEWTSDNKLKINSTWTAWKGATNESNGTAGYLGAPGTENVSKFLRGNGEWSDPYFAIEELTDWATTTTTTASNITFTKVWWKIAPTSSNQVYGIGIHPSNGLLYYIYNNKGTYTATAYSANTGNSWRNVYTNDISRVGTGTGTKAINFVQGNNITITYQAAGTSSGQSGSADYFNIKIDAVNTWTPWEGATDSANGTAGYMPAPTSAQRGQFLRGDGSWVSLNNYSLPTASNSTLGGVKTGAAITDTTGYTAVAIKDGVIYYKDTNTTYSFSNLQFQQTSGTNLMTYNSQAARTVLAGSNITFTHSNNVLTIAAKDTTYSTVSKTAAGLCPILPNETTTTKYLRQDGTWVTPPNTWKAANTSQEGYVPKSIANKILRADGDGALYWGDDANSTYNFVGTTFYSGNSGNAEHNANNAIKNGHYYYTSNGPTTSLGASTNDGALYVQSYSDSWVAQIAQDYRNGRLFIRGKNNGTWQSWIRIANYNEIALSDHTHAYTTLTGSGTTADQAIVSTGTANGWTLKTLGSRAFDSTSYLPLAGGTLTGKVTVNSSHRDAGMYGVYDSHYLGHVWSMGTSYAISADGKDPASLYGFAYFHTNWSNDATYNTNAANKTAIGTYAGGHQVGWFANGIIQASIGSYVWSKNGFKKNGSSDSYVLLGGGGHKAVSDFATSGHNHASSYVSAVALNGNNLRVTKNGSNSDLTIPYATNADTVDSRHATGFVYWEGNPSKNNMNDIARSFYSSTGMTNLASSSVDNGDMSGWTHFFSTSYADGGNGTNAWVFQLACPAGSSNLQFRSRKGGTITDGTAWAVGWTKILHAGNSSVSKSGETLTVKINDTSQSLTNTWRGIQNNLTSDSTTDSLSAAQGKALNSKFESYLPLSGGTMTGNITMGANSIVFNQATTSNWNVAANTGITLLNTVGASATGAPGKYYIGLSVSGYYGFQLATYGGGDTRLLFRNTARGSYPSWSEIAYLSDIPNPYSSTSQPGYTVTHSEWAYSRYYSGSNYWDIGTNQSAGGWGSNGGFGIRENGADNNGIYVRRATSSYGKLCVGTPSGECTIGYYVGGSSKWTVGCSDGTKFGWYQGSSGGWKMTLDTGGNLTATNFYTTSDRNKKTNISSFSEHIRKFQMKDKKTWHYGVIAQEVPEMFRQGEDGNMTVNYNSVLSYYVGCLENKVKELEEKIKVLETKQNKQI